MRRHLLTALLAMASLAGAGCVDGKSGPSIPALRVTFDDFLAWEIRYSACAGSRDFSFGIDISPLWAAGVSVSDDAVEQVVCIVEAEDCDAVGACFDDDWLEPCDPETFEPHCDGTTVVNCSGTADGGRVQRHSCQASQGGSQCILNADGKPTCAAGTCLDDADAYPRCDDQRYSRCERGAVIVLDCNVLPCTCDPKAPMQDEDDHCDGQYEVRCDEGRCWYRDCAWLGLQCIETTHENGHISAQCSLSTPDPECATESPPTDARCVGDRIGVCEIGRWVELDCSRFMDGTCVELPESDGWFDDDVRCAPGPG